MSFTTDSDLQNDAAASTSYRTAFTKRKDSLFEEMRSSDSAAPRKRIEHHARQCSGPSSSNSKTPADKLNQKSGTQLMISTKELPAQVQGRDMQTSAPTTQTPSSDIQLQPQPSQKQSIMICLARGPALCSLYQIPMNSAPANSEVFKRLSGVYKNEREHLAVGRIKIPPFWRHVAAIHFVRFRIHRPVPTRVEIRDMHSLPDGTPGWVCGYDTHDSISETLMAYYLYHPSGISEGLRWSVYEWLPRKLNGDLVAEPGRQGWGLYFEERWRWGVIALSAGTIFFTLYSIRILVGFAKGDESLGMTIASNNMVLLASVVTTAALVHALRM